MKREPFFTPFTPISWEKPVYEKLGVKVVKDIIPTNGRLVRRLLRAPKLNPSDPYQLDFLIFKTKAFETLHWVIGGFLVKDIASFFPHGLDLHHGISYGLLQVLGNVYPIMLQRYNRSLTLERLKKIQN